MKKLFSLVIFSMIVLILTECKKGENDPRISLRSRKSRVEGKWRFLEGSLTIGSTDITKAERYNEVYSFRDGRYTLTSTGDNRTTNTSVGIYMLSIGFDKKGNFTLDEYLDVKKLVATGTWDFNNGVGSDKKKEDLDIALKDVSSSQSSGYHFFNQSSINFTYRIKELRNKRMVLSAEVPIYINATGLKQTFYGEFTFVQ